MSKLFVAKKLKLFPKLGVSTRKRGRGQFFAILCGRLLWITPNINGEKNQPQVKFANVILF